jgi:L-histidine N-alpha-methyltransferase
MQNRMSFVEVAPSGPQQTLCQAVYDGLSVPQKSLPSRFFYDRRGSELFEEITQLPEYYLTRCEQSILEQQAPLMAEAAGSDLALIEFGSGSSIKTRLLIEAILARQPELRYVPIDISCEFLKSSSADLLQRYERLSITALGAEYFDAISAIPAHDGPRLILFLGSNIGNLTHEEATDFLRRLRTAMQPHDRILLGVDQVKDRRLLEAAYNDRAGVTAEFNRNVLRRINVELGANFDLTCFRHRAPYDGQEQRMEMRLYSIGDQAVSVEALESTFEFADGEYVHTEWSHKYTPESFGRLCAPAGLEICGSWMDERQWFGMMMLRPSER